MKKSFLFALIAVFFLAVGSAHVVDSTLLGPTQYVQTDRAPNLYADSFPRRPRIGKIIVQICGVDVTVLVSRAIIEINGI